MQHLEQSIRAEGCLIVIISCVLSFFFPSIVAMHTKYMSLLDPSMSGVLREFTVWQDERFQDKAESNSALAFPSHFHLLYIPDMYTAGSYLHYTYMHLPPSHDLPQQ
jgi:hypothetical protein